MWASRSAGSVPLGRIAIRGLRPAWRNRSPVVVAAERAGAVAVHGHDDGRAGWQGGGELVGVAAGESGAAGGDRQQGVVAVGLLVGSDGEDVERSLDHDRGGGGGGRGRPLSQSVEQGALVVDRGLRGVEVFRGVGGAGQVTSDEPGDLAAGAVDREDHPVAEGVDKGSAAAAAGEAGVEEQLLGEPLGESVGQVGPAGWGVAQRP